MNSRQKLILALPLIAILMIVFVYFQLFTNPLVDLAIIALYVVVSIRNKRKFDRQKKEAEAPRPKKKA